jgi:hypothetical protein
MLPEEFIYIGIVLVSMVISMLVIKPWKIQDGKIESKVESETIQKNKALVEKYPFLLVRHRMTAEVHSDYDYSYTELDSMPTGWRKAFGLQMCDEIKKALGDQLHDYRITDIKEKYGSLRWYDAGANESVYKVIAKYEKISSVTCIACGDPATKVTKGWISPYCDAHYPDNQNPDFYYEIVDGKIIDTEEEKEDETNK